MRISKFSGPSLIFVTHEYVYNILLAHIYLAEYIGAASRSDLGVLPLPSHAMTCDAMKSSGLTLPQQNPSGAIRDYRHRLHHAVYM